MISSRNRTGRPTGPTVSMVCVLWLPIQVRSAEGTVTRNLCLLLLVPLPPPPYLQMPMESRPTLFWWRVHHSLRMHMHVRIWPFTSARSLQRICLLTFNNWLEAWLRFKCLFPDWPCFHLLSSCKNGTFWKEALWCEGVLRIIVAIKRHLFVIYFFFTNG